MSAHSGFQGWDDDYSSFDLALASYKAIAFPDESDIAAEVPKDFYYVSLTTIQPVTYQPKAPVQMEYGAPVENRIRQATEAVLAGTDVGESIPGYPAFYRNLR